MTKFAESKSFVVVLAALFFVGHLTFQFFAWSVHPGNVAAPGEWTSLPWSISSFPLFAVLGNSVATDRFGTVLIANSLIWSVGLTWLTMIALRRSRSGQNWRPGAAGTAGNAPEASGFHGRNRRG